MEEIPYKSADPEGLESEELQEEESYDDSEIDENQLIRASINILESRGYRVILPN